MLGTLIASLMATETASAIAAVRRAAIAYGLAALLVLVAVGFGIGAAYIVAADRWGDWQAALGFGGAALLVAVVILMVHRIASGVRARRVQQRRKIETRTVAATAAVALLPLLLRRGGGIGIGGLLLPLAGLAAFQIFRENRRRSGLADDDL